jgi:transposase-like protein
MGKRRGPDRVYPQALKLAAVERMEVTRNITALSRELGVSRGLLYFWRSRYRAVGAAGLRQHGGRKQPAPPKAVPKRAGSDPGTAARIAALERKVGQQALELDFFRAALKHFGQPRPAADEQSETDSTP